MVTMNYELIIDQADVMNKLQVCTFHQDQTFSRTRKITGAMLQAMEAGNAFMILTVNNRHIVVYSVILQPEPNERWGRLDLVNQKSDNVTITKMIVENCLLSINETYDS